jgi:fumarate hydratase class II
MRLAACVHRTSAPCRARVYAVRDYWQSGPKVPGARPPMEAAAGHRLERDSLGGMHVPGDVLYGASTARAVSNFPISGLGMPHRIVSSLASIKLAAARANRAHGALDDDVCDAICDAAERVICDATVLNTKNFPCDVFQTGSGTSTNMNVNEVIAHLASARLERAVHPNDDVNRGQSSNDCFPAAVRIAAAITLRDDVLPSLRLLETSLRSKGTELWPVVHCARTHLQDALPTRLGAVFIGHAAQVAGAIQRCEQAMQQVCGLSFGTAVGTAFGAPSAEFAQHMVDSLKEQTKLSLSNLTPTAQRFAAQSCLDDALAVSHALSFTATAVAKSANDVRWLSAGPRAGLHEIDIPTVQPGSSMMPGKSNPVLCEALLQVCCAVLGGHSSLENAALLLGSSFELAAAWPLAGMVTVTHAQWLAAAVSQYARYCVDGITPTDAGPQNAASSLMLATALARDMGYDAAAAVAKVAGSDRSVTLLEAALRTPEGQRMGESRLRTILDPHAMLGPYDGPTLPT